MNSDESLSYCKYALKSIFSDSIGMVEESGVENKSGIRHFMSQKRRVGTSGGMPRSESVVTSSRSIRNNIMMNSIINMSMNTTSNMDINNFY